MKNTAKLAACLFYYIIAVVIVPLSLNAQIKIKEKIEISAFNVVNLQADLIPEISNIRLPPLNMNDFALEGSGFIESYDDIYDDNIFVSRIGGTMGLSLWQPNGSASGTTPDDILLTFGPDGTIRNVFPLNQLNERYLSPISIWDPYTGSTVSFETGDSISIFNPWNYSQELYDTYYPFTDTTYKDYWGWYPPYKISIPVNAWEPLRFRLYTLAGALVKPHFHTALSPYFYNVTQYPESYDYAISASAYSPLYSYSGVLVLRSRDCDSIGTYYDYATTFPMKWLSVDSNAILSSPPVTCSPSIILPDSGMYRIILTDAKPNVNGVLTFIDTVTHAAFSDIQNHIGDTILIGPYNEGSSLQVKFNGSDPSTTEASYGYWEMGFENWTDYDFEDVKVTVEYAVLPADHLELWSATSTIFYGDTLDVFVVPCGPDNLFSPLGEDEKFEFSVELKGETSQYCELIKNGTSDTLFRHIPSEGRIGVGLKLAANKIEPDSVVYLTFRLKAIYLGEIISSSTKTMPGIAPGDVTEKKNRVKIKTDKNHLVPTKDYQKGYSIFWETGNFKEREQASYPGGNRVKEKKAKMKYGNDKYRKHRTDGPVAEKDRIGVSNNSSPLSFVKKSMEEENAGYIYIENDWYYGERKCEILLGETKYFKARRNLDPNHPKSLIIEEVSNFNEDTGEPLSNGAEDVDFFVVNGTISKVYWESKWPKWDDKIIEEKIYKTAEMKDLKTGLVRVIGRYWQEGSKENVYLWARSKKDPDVAGYISIVVKKPTRLIDWKNIAGSVDENDFKGLKEDYCQSIDVFGQPFNIDELVISLAGENGIPPQMIKAQMFQEADKIGYHFNPSYRYEPFKDYIYQHNQENASYKKQPFYITNELIQGDGPGIPNNHSNLYPKTLNPSGYPTSRVRICDYTLDNCNWPKYWKYIKNGTEIEIIGSEDKLTKLWKKEFNYWNINWIIPGLYPMDLATIAVKKEIAKYTENAQTRKMASYGIIQMMYTTAIEDRIGFNKGKSIENSSPPESLNENDALMPLYKKFTLKNLENSMKKNDVPDHDWSDGWEVTWRSTLSKYNGKVNALKASSRTRYFEPKK